MDSANTAGLQFTNFAASGNDADFLDSLQYFTPTETTNQATKTTTDTTTAPATAPRNSKKRTRASRRAPTTVLTTDTTNFRAMVQEFTGIPYPPFGPGAAISPSPFGSSRFDLLGSGGGSGAINFSSPALSPPPPFLLRPFAQKAQKCSPSPGNDNTSVKLNSSVGNTKETDYNQQPSFPNLHSPIASYQSLLQAQLNPKFSISDTILLNSSDGGTKGKSVMEPSWVAGSASHGDNEQGHNSAVMYHNSSQQRGGLCKPVFGVSSDASEFSNAKEFADTTRGEGMIDSWICSSD